MKLLMTVLIFSQLLLISKAFGQSISNGKQSLNKSAVYLQAALKAEHWIHSQEVNKQDSGIAWCNIKNSAIYNSDLYYGNSGVVLFYLELYNITKQKQYLHKADQGLKYILLKHEPNVYPWNAGDLAGIIYTVHQGYLQTKNPLYKKAVVNYLSQLNQQIVQVDSLKKFMHVMQYSNVGSIFLYANMYKLTDNALSAAKHVGDILLNGSLKANVGIRWTWASNADTAEKASLPNFSHGTAGVAAYLAQLFKATKDERYLIAAREAGNYLISISNDSGWVPHWYPFTNSNIRYYLGVCHGPAGTSRLFYQLSEITREQKWLDIIKLAANSIMESGIPKKRTTGFWNNVSQCCGSAGIAEWYLSLDEHYTNAKYVAFSKQMLDDILERATLEDDMMNWVQAENRHEPEKLKAQTGYMQGASGIGIALLHMYAHENGKKFLIKLPDNPF